MESDKIIAETGDEAHDGAAVKLSRGGRATFVHATLQREILSLSLAPGSPLDETQLSERFGMSRSPIREALSRLAAEKLIETLPNRTTIVAPLNLADFPPYLEALDLMQRVCTRLAAERRTERDLAEIRRAVEAFDRSLEPYDHLEMSARNKDFHMAIAQAARNHHFAAQYGALLDQGRRILHLNFENRPADQAPAPLAEDHHLMIAAIEARDAEEAERLAVAHTRGFRRELLDLLGNIGTEAIDLGRSGDSKTGDVEQLLQTPGTRSKEVQQT